jgi:hypothetical protein
MVTRCVAGERQKKAGMALARLLIGLATDVFEYIIGLVWRTLYGEYSVSNTESSYLLITQPRKRI